MSDVLVFQHAAGEGTGYLGEMLGRYRAQHRVLHVHEGTPVPASLEGAGGLILLGGPMSVNDGLPWIAAEQALVREAVAAGLPVLGICLGAQQVAAALGGTVMPAPVAEIGWLPVQQLPGPDTDRWLSGLPAQFDAFHWHGETFSLPEGAAPILASEACANQGFVAGSALALQFHLEMTAAMVRDWAQHAPPEAGSLPTVQTTATMCAALDERVRALNGIAEHVFGRFLAELGA